MKTKCMRFSLGLVVATMSLGGAQTRATEFEKPFRVESNGKPIDAESGWASPCLVDFDGDGIKDLLVGQRGECKLRIYRNQGSDTAPNFNVSALFRAGGVEATLPGG